MSSLGSLNQWSSFACAIHQPFQSFSASSHTDGSFRSACSANSFGGLERLDVEHLLEL
jgi:hypothetical protein